MEESKRTRYLLAAELRAVGAKSPPDKAEKYEAFAVRALTGEFDDYGTKYDCPITQLWKELHDAGLHRFAKRVADGEFDATKEESDEWARSPEAQEMAKELPPEMRKLFGLDLLN